jgi:hypothetical protein
VYVNRRCDQGYKEAFRFAFIGCWTAGAEPFRNYRSQYCTREEDARRAKFLGNPLTGRSDVCSELGPRRPLTCSGLGVAVPPPCSEFIELLTLLEGVDDCCTAPFSFMRPFELLKEDCDPATPFEPSLVPCALSAFFLLLKRNAIVPFEAGNLLCYANLLQTLLVFVISRNLFSFGVGSSTFRWWWDRRFCLSGPRVRLGMAGDLRSEGRDGSYTTSSRTADSQRGVADESDSRRRLLGGRRCRRGCEIGIMGIVDSRPGQGCRLSHAPK